MVNVILSILMLFFLACTVFVVGAVIVCCTKWLYLWIDKKLSKLVDNVNQ